ncbi:MAG: aminotransferase class V-fold PLP-dependent enzyme [Oscillospiraceae bacterium]|nr:aminotransferase class V-fold PLP-dependent enzyme [Oscillospiraceae bacterium]
MKKVYVDNSSTSFPKTPGISDVIKDYIENTGCNVNRGGYSDSYDTAMEILDTRTLLADFFHTGKPAEVVFTPGITYSLNLILQGFLSEGDHVITSSMEHNSVMRPLHALSKKGVSYDTVPCGEDGSLCPAKLASLIRKETKAVVMLHASNVNGTIMPVNEVSEICRKNNIRFILDTAQTAGVLDINADGIDALAFTGHKGLLGPQGIGGLIIKSDFANEIEPLIFGGTGSQSHEFAQPGMLPDKFESGTMNIPGILALKKSIEYINSIGIKTIFEKEMELTSAFIEGIKKISGIEIVGNREITEKKETIGNCDTPNRVAVVSLNFPGKDNAQIAAALDEKYGIMTRCGLHCAPNAHKTLNTYPHGTLRLSFGYFNTSEEIEYIIECLKRTQGDDTRGRFSCAKN